MKINAVNPGYLAGTTKSGFKINNDPSPIETSKAGMSVISFKGGNKDQVLHVVAECKPFNQTGGVATVVQDYQQLNNATATGKGMSVFVTPFYNGIVKYECQEGAAGLQQIKVDLPRVPAGLPDGHPLKNHVGQPVYTKVDLSKTSLLDALKSGKDYWLLEEVADKKMSWGMEEEAPVKLLKVVSDSNGKPFKDNVFMVFSEATAFDPKPYSLNQYSSAPKEIVRSFNGDPYAKFNKAVVEFMEDISKKMGNFDPGTVVCSDSQAAYVTHYMAQKNAAGVEYFKDKKPMQIGHNLGDGYIGKTSARNMIVNLNIFTPQELEALTKSEDLRRAIVTGGKIEEDFFNGYLKNINAKYKLSAMSIPVHYGNTGYLQTFGVVSQGYLDEITQNPEIAPSLSEDLKALKEKGVAVGLTNPLNSKNSAFTKVGLEGYNTEHKVKLTDGTEEVIKPLKMFTEQDRVTLTLDKVREIKRENKINFLNRFSPKYNGAQYFNTKNNQWTARGDNYIRRGNDGAIQVVQNIDVDKYVSKLKNGEDVKVVVSWGRGDFQKAFDEALNGFKNYVLKTGDKDTLLIMGGDLANDKVEGQKIKDIAELLSKDPLFKGRVMLLDAFAPGEPMALMADAALLPSRFAPCELTDLEAKKMLCTPIVPNGQGMGQKNFDPAIAGEASMADAFKTKHQYYDSKENFLKDASQEAKDEFNKVYNKIKNEIVAKYKLAMGNDPSPETIEKFIEGNDDFQTALRKLRDSVMADDIAECLNRCLNEHRNDSVAETILKNQINMKTGWEENQQITRSNVATGELYRNAFHKDAHNISNPADVIGHGIKKPHSVIDEIKHGISSKKAAIIAAAAAIAGLAIGYIAFKSHKNDGELPKENRTKKEKEQQHLSTIG